MSLKIDELRTEYRRATLDESSVEPDPIRQFERWFSEAVDAKMPEPNAMTLATVDADGKPSARIVLLKGADERGFTFFTNYASRKGRELAVRSRAALLFYWPELERQIRIEGAVTRVDAGESTQYFAGRPRPSQLGAWASPQSEPIGGRAELEARFAEVADRYRDADAAGAPARRTGAAIGSCPTRSSSGRDARQGFTIASAIAEHRRIRPHGSSTGWRRDCAPVRPTAPRARRRAPCRFRA